MHRRFEGKNERRSIEDTWRRLFKDHAIFKGFIDC